MKDNRTAPGASQDAQTSLARAGAEPSEWRVSDLFALSEECKIGRVTYTRLTPRGKAAYDAAIKSAGVFLASAHGFSPEYVGMAVLQDACIAAERYERLQTALTPEVVRPQAHATGQAPGAKNPLNTTHEGREP